MKTIVEFLKITLSVGSLAPHFPQTYGSFPTGSTRRRRDPYNQCLGQAFCFYQRGARGVQTRPLPNPLHWQPHLLLAQRTEPPLCGREKTHWLGCSSSASLDCPKFWKIPMLPPSTPSEIHGFLLAKPFVCLPLSSSYFHHLPNLMEAWLFLRMHLPESPCNRHVPLGWGLFALTMPPQAIISLSLRPTILILLSSAHQTHSPVVR